MSGQDKENHFRLLLLLVDGGTPVLRKVFDSKVAGTLYSFLSTKHGKLNFLHGKKVINDAQWTLLTGTNPTSSDFDLSLLTSLLRNICGLAKSTDNVWISSPSASDLTIEADITRIKEHRNKISHLPETGILQPTFQTAWSDICQILIRINSNLPNGVPDLQNKLESYKTCSIDQETMIQYKELLKEWDAQEAAQHNLILEEIKAMREDLDQKQQLILNLLKDVENTQTIQQHISATEHKRTRAEIRHVAHNITEKMKERKLSPEQERLIELSKNYFEEADQNKETFVKTNAYNVAREMLDKTGIVVLSGHPGEGKSTMAQNLLLESSPIGKNLKLSHPSNWDIVPKGFNSILIDDIFGFRVVDEQLLSHWNRYLSTVKSQAERKNVAAVVITTRHYILNEAIPKLSVKGMFSDTCIVILSSENLSQPERLKILNNHLKENKRDLNDDEKAKICSTEGNDDDKHMIGFPACSAMFATNDNLFQKGSEFFKSPYEFFLQCIEFITENEDKFMSLILVWVSESHRFAVSQLDPDNISKLICVAEDFSYTKLQENAKVLRGNLKQLEKCFLTYDDNEETYTFGHHIIGDAVGIVAAKENRKAVIKYATSGFIMNHVTTSEDTHTHFKLKKMNYKLLVEKMNTLLFDEGLAHEHGTKDSERKYSLQSLDISGMKLVPHRHDITVLKHEAFDNVDFVKEYLNTQNQDVRENCLHVPILYACDHFRFVLNQKNEMHLCMPSVLLALGKDKMIKECIERNILSSEEQNISLLLAVKNKQLDMVKDLVLKVKAKISEESVTIAKHDDNNKEILAFLVDQKTTPYSLAFDLYKLNIESAVPANNIAISSHSEPKRNTAYTPGVILYTLGCKMFAERSCKQFMGKETQSTKADDVYHLGFVDLCDKLLQYEPPNDMNNVSWEMIFSVMLEHTNTSLVSILFSDDPLRKYRRLMKSKIGKQSLFHHAVLTDDMMLLLTAIELRLDPNGRDVYGRTAIYLASSYGKSEFVETLINIPHLNLELSEKNGCTPFHAAVWENKCDIVSFLLHYVNVNCRDKRGNTPLHMACTNANPDIIRILTSTQATDVRVVNKYGDTVFHSLESAMTRTHNAKGFDTKIATCLLLLSQHDSGLNSWLPNKKNKNGMVPFQ